MKPHLKLHLDGSISLVVKTAQQVKNEFFQSGTSVRQWARDHGFKHDSVYRLLSGRADASYGESHRVAVALGMKAGQAIDVANFNPAEHREAA